MLHEKIDGPICHYLRSDLWRLSMPHTCTIQQQDMSSRLLNHSNKGLVYWKYFLDLPRHGSMSVLNLYVALDYGGALSMY